ncbi:MAG: diacylglycerol kinase [Gammaproteobacteria bacterium]|jgi:diacylglycerol kinase (ATP)|nr:diacylglycerol kinase [Gammaproteobacteria bacterium]MBT6043638.1 diacylglycerol kinase [Gammaproteobacteria bacterium]
MAKPGETGIKRIISATHNSIKGFKACWQHEAAFRQEAYLCIILVPLGLILGENGIEKSLLVGVCLLVLVVEILNSGIEAVVDRISHEHHELSGRAKDMGSAAVFVSLVMVGIVWALVLFF